jgi:hypothetical protein
VTALRLHPVDRRRTVAEPVEEPDAWWALYLAVCAWQKTLPSGDDHIWAFPCSHCRHCGGALLFNFEGSGAYSHCYERDEGRRECRPGTPSEWTACCCARWANAVAAYQATLPAIEAAS